MNGCIVLTVEFNLWGHDVKLKRINLSNGKKSASATLFIANGTTEMKFVELQLIISTFFKVSTKC